MSIKLLPPEVYNKIAAGEVVERPASVVKELLENSIDSGAANISVEIWGGGIDRITVSDNGCGIEKDDVKSAFMPHATSKITSADDLFDLNTLGFRGEALASIAAVSRVTMVTRTKNDTLGQKISVKGGFIEYFEEQGSPEGTYITVENLFFNVPARAKFLKTARSEESEITNIVARLILANPCVSIKLNADGETVYRSGGQGLKAAVFSVYGMEAAENCLPLNYGDKGLQISGFIGKPGFFKPNRTYQTLIVNGRYVVSHYISKAVADVFEGYLMKHQYPFFVICVNIDKRMVDVNVHPNKTEVRFINLYSVAATLKKAINGALDSDKNVMPVKKPEILTPETVPGSEIINVQQKAEALPSYAKDKSTAAGLRTNNELLAEFFAGKNKDALSESSDIIKRVLSRGAQQDQIGFSMPQGFEEKPVQEIANKEIKNENANNLSGLSGAKILGAVFSAYILIEYRDSVYFIDQHAAHERILYDALRAAAGNSQTLSQDMLAPYIFSTNPAETRLLTDNLENIAGIGFVIEQFGRSEFRVLSVPAALSDIDIAAFVNTLLEDATFFKLKTNDILKERLMQAACRAAVKAGDTLAAHEIDVLIKQIVIGDTALRCPHGRPVIVRLEKAEIEKWFKRRL